MKKKLYDALEEIPDQYIMEASSYKRIRVPRQYKVIAAVLAAVILLGVLVPWKSVPFVGQFIPLAAPAYPKMASYSSSGIAREKWLKSLEEQYDQPEGYADSLDTFFKEAIPAFLSAAEGENAVCSPVNIYMALALLAECAEGNSRQQILDLMQVDSIEALREQASYVWNAHYRNDNVAMLLMSNSLWLDDGFSYRQETADILASHYYASAYRTDLGSSIGNRMLRDWLNKETGGLLGEQANELELDPGTVLAVASTIQYKVSWANAFNGRNSEDSYFRGTKGTTTVTYMIQAEEMDYYWAENFSAVTVPLADGSKIWLIRPDSYKISPEELLEEKTAVNMVMGDLENVGTQKAKVKLYLPKFDVQSKSDLADAVKELGVTEIFSAGRANFQGLCPGESGLYINRLEHNARLTADESGIVGVAYSYFSGVMGGPPDGEVRFKLNKPFLFIITSPDGLPLFTGIVNNI